MRAHALPVDKRYLMQLHVTEHEGHVEVATIYGRQLIGASAAIM